jgi:hypothetical protein
MVSIDWTLQCRVRSVEPVLHEFLQSSRANIIARTKTKLAARAAPSASEAELTEGIPLFLDQLVDILQRSKLHSPELDATATKHGDDLLRLGFTVGQVVHDYGDVCQAVTELAFELDAHITVDEFHTLNSCLDDATAQAVTEYSRLREKAMAEQENEQVGALRRQMRNHIDTALLSFDVLRGGRVSVSGSTGALHERSLKALNDLIDRLPK